MAKKSWLLWASLVMVLTAVPLAWGLDPGANDVNLNNFDRPLLGKNQLYFGFNTGITWHDERSHFDQDRRIDIGNLLGLVTNATFVDSWELRVRDRWNQWNAGAELGFGVTDKITMRVRGNFNFPAGSRPRNDRDYDGIFGGTIGGVPGVITFDSLFHDEDFSRLRKSESFGASIAYRPFNNLEFYATTDAQLSWFREDAYFRSSNGTPLNFGLPIFGAAGAAQKTILRERSYNQELLAGVKYIYELPAYDKKIAAMDLRRSPQPKVVDLTQWDRAMLHMGEFMVNPYGGVRFVDIRQTFFDRQLSSFGMNVSIMPTPTDDRTRLWPTWTFDQTARDVFAQGILGAQVAVGITDSLLVEGGYKYYLPVSYKRFVTRKNGNWLTPLPVNVNSLFFNFYNEDDLGQHEGWAGNAKLTFRLNPWFQVYGAFDANGDHSQFFTDAKIFSNLLGLNTGGTEEGEIDRRLGEHRVTLGLTFLTPVKGDDNPAPGAKRTLSDLQRPLLRPFQFGANIFGGWRMVKDVFVQVFNDTRTNTPLFAGIPLYDYKSRTYIDRSFHQGFIGADVYFGILESLQFDTTAHFYAPTKYGHRNARTVTHNIIGLIQLESKNQERYHSGELYSWDVSPRFTFRPRPNIEAFLGATFAQQRVVFKTEQKRQFLPGLAVIDDKNKQEFTKNENIYNVNAGIKVLFP